jgi:hypothetical protein
MIPAKVLGLAGKQRDMDRLIRDIGVCIARSVGPTIEATNHAYGAEACKIECTV